MKERNGATSGNEDYLFHGTDESLIEAICEQNFDWRMCGVHGTLYGKGTTQSYDEYTNVFSTNEPSYSRCIRLLDPDKIGVFPQNRAPPTRCAPVLTQSLLFLGSYFARDASYSDRYAASKSLNKIMFVALVLVGEFTKGRSSYVRPPPKGNGKTLYDSCVDSESNPSIYVVFEKQQIYPEYLIDYS